MEAIDRLQAIEEIKQLKARYFRGVDTKDWALFGSVFAPDAFFDISQGGPERVFTGPAAIVEAARVPLTGCTSVHHGHCPEIEILSDDTAKGIWAMEDMLRWSADSATPGRTVHGYGHYHETYARLDGRWHIQTMKLTRLRVDTNDPD